jgi:hypothetical protein
MSKSVEVPNIRTNNTILPCFNTARQSMPVARAFREAKDALPRGEPGEDGTPKETGGLVKNVSTRWNSNLSMFRYTAVGVLVLDHSLVLHLYCCNIV